LAPATELQVDSVGENGSAGEIGSDVPTVVDLMPAGDLVTTAVTLPPLPKEAYIRQQVSFTFEASYEYGSAVEPALAEPALAEPNVDTVDTVNIDFGGQSGDYADIR
jgi:hypothetical protein